MLCRFCAIVTDCTFDATAFWPKIAVNRCKIVVDFAHYGAAEQWN